MSRGAGQHAAARVLLVPALAACGAPPGGVEAPPTIVMTVPSQTAVVGAAVRFDASLGGSAFVNSRNRVLRYVVHLEPGGTGLTADGAWIRGVAATPGVVRATIVAIDTHGDSASQRFPIAIFAAGLPTPVLPDSGLPYSPFRNPLPRHFRFDVTGSALAEDNTPRANPTTDAGAALGRVLFYDPRLSITDRIACASCHHQRLGFGDTARFSRGAHGALTRRHAMPLTNARFYRAGRFFRDERAATLEQQVLQPIQDSIEMGLPLDALLLKLQLTAYYPPLFRAAFGTPAIDSDRVARALAQFVRSLASYRALVDSVFRGGGPPDTTWLSPVEREGRTLFLAKAGCARCHRTNAMNIDLAENVGLDSVAADSGAGGGKFKAPSLRNVAVRPPYMHDGRFRTLGEVVDFYDHGIQSNPHLDDRLRAADGTAMRLNLSQHERDALVAYLATFTDQAFLHDVRFSDPFARRGPSH